MQTRSSLIEIGSIQQSANLFGFRDGIEKLKWIIVVNEAYTYIVHISGK